MDIEELFKSVIALIFGIILLGALADVFKEIAISQFYSFMIGFAFLAIVIAVLLKILEELGGLR